MAAGLPPPPLLLLLVCVGVALRGAGAQDPYDELHDSYKKGVDLALEQLSSHESVQHHFRFWRTVAKSNIESGFGVNYLYHHFHLKPTRCSKGTADATPQSCPYRTDRPQMDCAVCYKTLNEQIEVNPKPYVHCIQKRRLTEEMKTTRTSHCQKMSYNSGAPTLLAVSTGQS